MTTLDERPDVLTPKETPRLPRQDLAEAGAKFLDENGPQNWRDKIQPAELELSSSTDCVLGQLYGDYGVGLASLRINGFQERELGFDGRTSTMTWLSVLGHDPSTYTGTGPCNCPGCTETD